MRRLIRALLLGAALLAAQAAHALSAVFADYGVYSVSRGETTDNAGVAGGLVVTYGKRLIERTTDVSAGIGTNFGFRYLLSDWRGREGKVGVTIRVIHPEPLRDPATGKSFAVSEWRQEVPLKRVNWNTGWVFEHDWELVPGKWTIQLYAEDALLLEKDFNVRLRGPAVKKLRPSRADAARQP